MLSSRRNRGTLHRDNDRLDDGFYRIRQFKVRNVGQKGKRPWRRAVRSVEKKMWKKEWL